jgi:predicted Zn-ribbon and HTH transcriptional regulator
VLETINSPRLYKNNLLPAQCQASGFTFSEKAIQSARQPEGIKFKLILAKRGKEVVSPIADMSAYILPIN